MPYCNKCTQDLPIKSFSLDLRNTKKLVSGWCKTCTNTLVRKRMQMIREQVLTLFDNKCGHCSFSDPRALQLDHIHGGGLKELKRLGNSHSVYLNALKNPANYQLLCANCNWIKRYTNQEVHNYKFQVKG